MSHSCPLPFDCPVKLPFSAVREEDLNYNRRLPAVSYLSFALSVQLTADRFVSCNRSGRQVRQTGLCRVTGRSAFTTRPFIHSYCVGGVGIPPGSVLERSCSFTRAHTHTDTHAHN